MSCRRISLTPSRHFSLSFIASFSTQQRGPSGPPIEQLEFRASGELERRWWNDKHVPTEAGPPGSRLSSPGEREINAVIAIRVGVNMLQFCSVFNSLSHTTLSMKWEVYFSKDLCPLVFIASLCFCMHICMYSCCSWLHNTKTQYLLVWWFGLVFCLMAYHLWCVI